MTPSNSERNRPRWVYAAGGICWVLPAAALLALSPSATSTPQVLWEPDGSVTIPPGRYRLVDLIAIVAATTGTQVIRTELLQDREVDIAVCKCPPERLWIRLLSGWSFSIEWERDVRDPHRWVPVRVRLGESEPNPDPRTAVRPLEWSAEPSMEELADRIVTGTNTADTAAATLALARMDSPDAADALLRSLQHVPAGRLRTSLLFLAARELSATSAVPILVAYARSAAETDIRETALRALSRLATLNDLQRWLEGSTSDTNVGLATLWLDVVRRASNPAWEPLLREWSRAYSNAQELERATAALQGLASLGTERSIQYLLSQLDQGPEPIRAAAANALHAVPPGPVAPAWFRNVLANPSSYSEDTRRRVLDALARAPDAVTVESIRSAAEEDPSPSVRDHARRIYQALGVSIH